MNSFYRNQRTLARTAQAEGVGYWSGQRVRLEFRPAPADTGIVFIRSDLPGKPAVPAHVGFCFDSSRRTNLALGQAVVEMVEHVMAALAGLCIDNCEVWCNGREMPGCDGSSLAFVESLQAAGVCKLDRPRGCVELQQTIRVGDEKSWIEARPRASGKAGLHLGYELDYGVDRSIGRQTISLEISTATFVQELAPARTFLLEKEAQVLRSQGLGNHVGNQDLLIFGREGVIGNTLRFPDECVRHKTLDLLGDLALIGCDLSADVTASRSGHRLNAELARAVLAQHASHRSQAA